MADTPDIQEDDIADVSLTDTPDIPVTPTDTPSESDNTEPNKAADTSDKSTDTPEDQDAKPNEAIDQNDEGDTPDDSPSDQPKDKSDSEAVVAEDKRRIAQREWRDRQRSKQAIEQQIDQSYGPKSQDDLIDEGLKPQDAQVEALRQEMAYKENRAYIAELNAGMQADAVNAINDFPVFNEKSPNFDPEFTEMVEKQYKTASRLQTDDNGIIVNAEIPLYDYYQQMAQIYNRGSSQGSVQGQADMRDMLARTENPGGSSSTNAPHQKDSVEEMEDRLGDVVIT